MNEPMEAIVLTMYVPVYGKERVTHAIVSPEDFEWVQRVKWYLQNGYATSSKGRMHVLIMEKLTNVQTHKETVDHRDMNKLNNARSNLRWATHSQQMRNKRLRENNKSGVVGVSFSKKMNMWRADISLNGKMRNLGSWKTKEEAIEARLKAEMSCYGEFVPNYSASKKVKPSL